MKRLLGIAVAIFVMAPVASSAGADTGLVGEWHLDEGRGTTVVDSSGHGNNGTLLGGATWVTGRVGRALSFGNGTGGVEVRNSPSLEPASAVTVSAWVNHAGSPGNYRYILAKGASSCITASYGLYSGPNGGLEFYVSTGRGVSYVPSPDAPTTVWDGNWHFVVGTFDGSRVRLFVDGTEVGSGSPRSGQLEYGLRDSNDLFIGDYPACPLKTFVGAIDEVEVWNRALSGAEMQADMAQPGQTPSPAGGQPAQSTGQPPTNAGGGRPTGAPGAPNSPPVLGALRVSPGAFAVTLRGHRGLDKRPIGATVSYSDTQAARSTFTVLVAKAGVVEGKRCVKPSPRNPGKRRSRCTRYSVLGSFTHADRAGRDRFYFVGLPGRRLSPGTYRLEATPSKHRRMGRTVSASFTIIP